MARSQLAILLLACLPAVAQVKQHTIGILPSGGNVGEICFYETVANGSNKACLTIPSSLASDQSIDITALAGNFDYTPTAYSNTTWEHALHVSVNGADSQTIIQAIQGGSQYTADGIDVAHDCPASSTNWECGALSGAVLNGSTSTNAVALRGYVVQSAAGTGTSEANRVRMWGLNTLCDDGGFDYALCVNELDFNVNGTTPKIVGVSVGGVGTSASLDAGSVGFNVASLGTPKWPVGFGTADGSSTVGFAMGTLNTGSNTPSQTMQWWARNSGGTTQRGFLYMDADGNTVLGAGASASPVYLALLGNGRLSLPYEGATLNGHLLFGAVGTQNIADSTNYFLTAFGKNADLAPSGVTNNYTQVRKLEIADNLNGTKNFWDFQYHYSPSVGNNFLKIRDNGGNVVMQLEREYVSATTNSGYVDLHWRPWQNATWDLGSSSYQWKDGRFSGTLYAQGEILGGAIAIGQTTSGYIQQGATIRLDTSGGFNGAYYQVGGVSTIDSSRQWSAGNLLPSTDGGGYLGSSSYRWTGAEVSTSIYINDGTYLRFAASGGSVVGRNSSGTTQWTISTTGGTMETINGYKTNGLSGTSITFNVRRSDDTAGCTITVTGGIVTGGTC